MAQEIRAEATVWVITPPPPHTHTHTTTTTTTTTTTRIYFLLRSLISINKVSMSLGNVCGLICLQGMLSSTYNKSPPPGILRSLIKGFEYPSILNWQVGKEILIFVSNKRKISNLSCRGTKGLNFFSMWFILRCPIRNILPFSVFSIFRILLASFV